MGLTRDNINGMARKAQGYNQTTCLSVCIHVVKLPENLCKVRVIKIYLNIAHDDKCVWLFMHSPCQVKLGSIHSTSSMVRLLTQLRMHKEPTLVELQKLRPIFSLAISNFWEDPSQQAIVSGVAISSTTAIDHYPIQL